MTSLVVAAVQMRSGTEPKANIANMEELARDAASRGATYIQTPEMTGCLMRDKAALMASIKTDEEDPVVAAASSLASELGVWFHLGSTAIDAGEGMAANRAFVRCKTAIQDHTPDAILNTPRRVRAMGRQVGVRGCFVFLLSCFGDHKKIKNKWTNTQQAKGTNYFGHQVF